MTLQKEEPKVSIIVPVYNHAQYLPEAFESVIKQTYTNWECIIVNDGSPDNTEETALRWTEKDKRFRYLKKENGGLSNARNAGIQISTGKYILPLDADDAIEKTYLEDAVSILDNNANYKIVYCQATFFGEKSGLWEMPACTSLEDLIFGNMIFCCALYRKSDYDKTAGYNSNMIYGLEDWDFWLSLLESGGTIFQIPKPLFYYRIKAGSMASEIDENRLQYLYRQVYLNHQDLYNRLFTNPINAYSTIKQQEKTIRQLEKQISSLENSGYSKNIKKLRKMFSKKN